MSDYRTGGIYCHNAVVTALNQFFTYSIREINIVGRIAVTENRIQTLYQRFHIVRLNFAYAYLICCECLVRHLGQRFALLHAQIQSNLNLYGLPCLAVLFHLVRRPHLAYKLHTYEIALVLRLVYVITERQSPIVERKDEHTRHIRNRKLYGFIAFAVASFLYDMRYHLLYKNLQRKHFVIRHFAILGKTAYVILQRLYLKQLRTYAYFGNSLIHVFCLSLVSTCLFEDFVAKYQVQPLLLPVELCCRFS